MQHLGKVSGRRGVHQYGVRLSRPSLQPVTGVQARVAAERPHRAPADAFDDASDWCRPTVRIHATPVPAASLRQAALARQRLAYEYVVADAGIVLEECVR